METSPEQIRARQQRENTKIVSRGHDIKRILVHPFFYINVRIVVKLLGSMSRFFQFLFEVSLYEHMLITVGPISHCSSRNDSVLH